MILGIGSDLTDIRRIERSVARFGERFLSRIFTAGERERANGSTAALARRFAAKEAAVKALGLGIRRGIRFVEIEVVNDVAGKPNLRLHGIAKEKLDVIVPTGTRPHLHLTLTDEYPYAQAFVVIEAV